MATRRPRLQPTRGPARTYQLYLSQLHLKPINTRTCHWLFLVFSEALPSGVLFAEANPASFACIHMVRFRETE